MTKQSRDILFAELWCFVLGACTFVVLFLAATLWSQQ